MQAVAKSKNGTPLFNCVCPGCGTIRVQDKRKIGTYCVSCAAKARRTHGMSNSRLYRVWSGMVSRCKYPSTDGYKYYGARGITVCVEWESDFETFKAWAEANGYSDEAEIDREDTNGNYCPTNCRFVSHMDNSQNRRNGRCSLEQATFCKRLLAKGITISAAAREAGIPYMSAWHISKGNTWSNA